MSCPECANIVERTDIPHVIRKCACGRELHVFEPGDHGRGFRIRAGDVVTIPAGWLQMSLNPLRTRGRLYRPAIEMLANELFIDSLNHKKDTIWEELAALERKTDEIVNAFPPLAGLDVNCGEHTTRIIDILQEHRSTKEFYTFWAGHFLAFARGAKEHADLDSAVWGIACAERCLAMMKFKDSLEDVVWMGHSVSRLRDVLAVWDGHAKNSSEEFWQETFKEHSFVLSQVFAEPIVFIQDKAYVGGMRLDRSDARFVDYLFSVESSREAVLVEIKTPTTPLLGGEYRGHRLPSRDLTGAVIQVAHYRVELVQSLRTLASEVQLSAFAPKCVVIVGNSVEELAAPENRRSFELYRASLHDVEVITYDELFRKVEILADLFGLKRTRPAAQPPSSA